jgi:isoquinoline 1-oxidoreductase beta subunit
MGIKRRVFLIGSAAVLGGGVFALKWADSAAVRRAAKLTAGNSDWSFATWLKIAADDTVTIYSPHIDFGQGSNTALAQMVADELDADWSKIRIESAPPDPAFANAPLAKGFLAEVASLPKPLINIGGPVFSLLARRMDLQTTGGSTAVRMTGQFGLRVAAAATRLALLEAAAERLEAPANELTTSACTVSHAASGRSLRYGEVAAEAAQRTLASKPTLKTRAAYRFIGKSAPRLDVPTKVSGEAQYGSDFSLPNLRIATIAAAPARGGKLESVDTAPAIAVSGVEQVIKLDDAVAVVAKSTWPAMLGLRALAPKFSDGGHGAISSASVFSGHDAALAAGKPADESGEGDVDAALAVRDAKTLTATYRVPFLHQAMMEPFAMTAWHRDGKLELWGGLQDPLATRMLAAEAAGLDAGQVVFHSMIMGGGFGRRFPMYAEIIQQVVALAMQLPHPVKLVWTREEDVRHGAYRAQCTAQMRAALGTDGKLTAWRSDYAQPVKAGGEAAVRYTIPAVSYRHFEYTTNQVDGFWRSVNHSQHGFFSECFMDELAELAGTDPYEFRRRHLAPGSRHLRVLDEVARRSGWGSATPAGVGRGIALVQSFGTIVAQVIEASMESDGTPRVHKVYAVADCGTTVNPRNAEAQVQGGIVMGLSSAIGEAITLENGAVQQSNFSDYPLLRFAATPPIDVHFIESDGPIGGLGEPGTPPAAPALANALFRATGTRIRQLPIVSS